MRSITEEKVDWSILSDTLTLELPPGAGEFPILVRVFNASNDLLTEIPFEQPPVILVENLPQGVYRYEVVKDNQCIFSHVLTP